MEAGRVVVRVAPVAGPDCGGHIRRWRERVWRQFDTCQCETLIAARVPSVKHASGRVEEVSVPWAERSQRVTRLMVQACGSVSQVAGVMGVNWHTVDAIMKAAVKRGLARRASELVRQRLYSMNLRTSRAWRLKETLRALWDYASEAAAGNFFCAWLAQVTRFALPPMKKVAEMFVCHLDGMLSHIERRITNAASEGINSQVARIIANARGISSFQSLRTRVLFFVGQLHLSPA